MELWFREGAQLKMLYGGKVDMYVRLVLLVLIGISASQSSGKPAALVTASINSMGTPDISRIDSIPQWKKCRIRS